MAATYLYIGHGIFDNFVLFHSRCSWAQPLYTTVLYPHISYIHLYIRKDYDLGTLMADSYLHIGRNIFDRFLLSHSRCSWAWLLHTKLLYPRISYLHLHVRKMKQSTMKNVIVTSSLLWQMLTFTYAAIFLTNFSYLIHVAVGLGGFTPSFFILTFLIFICMFE